MDTCFKMHWICLASLRVHSDFTHALHFYITKEHKERTRKKGPVWQKIQNWDNLDGYSTRHWKHLVEQKCLDKVKL